MEQMVREMEDIVFNNPASIVSDAKKAIIAKYASEYSTTDPALWDDILAELGNLSPDTIERRLRRVREKVLGKVPKTREEFDPDLVFKKIAGGEKIITVDSSRDLPENWRELLDDDQDLSPEWQKFLEAREK